jgi:hypothetical protein
MQKGYAYCMVKCIGWQKKMLWTCKSICILDGMRENHANWMTLVFHAFVNCHMANCPHEPNYPFCIVRWRQQHANRVYILHSPCKTRSTCFKYMLQVGLDLMGGACRQPSEVTCQIDPNLISLILFLS